MSTAEIDKDIESNRELFFKTQKETEAHLARIAIDAAGFAKVDIANIALPSFDLGIIYEPEDDSLVSAAFTYHRGVDSRTLPWVRLKTAFKENGMNYATRKQLYPDEAGLIVLESIRERSIDGVKPEKTYETIKPSTPSTIIEMAELVILHAREQQG
jgi:hypothetical protein